MQGWEWITAARIISHKPCKLLGLVVTPSAGDGEITVYDGENTTAPPILNIFLATRNSRHYNFPGGLQTDRGLYIGGFSHVTGVLVQWGVD